MAIYDFFLSRNGAPVTAENYVGHSGRLFYDDANGVVKLSDGVTPGGQPIPYTIATDTIVGGIKEGPGVTIDSEGVIFIDSAGLSFTFGDFGATVENIAGSDVAVLSSLNLNENIVVETNGTGTVDIVGKFNVHATNGTLTGSLAVEPILKITEDSKIRLLVPNADQVEGGLAIVGNADGSTHDTNQTGVVLHTTGTLGLPGRNYFDAGNNYSLLVGRRYNGLPNATTPVLAGETILRVVGQASTEADFQLFGPCRMDMRTTQDQAVGAQGGEIAFYVTPLNTVAQTSSIDVLKLNAETGVTAVDVNPQIDETYDLGSPNLRWRNVYIGRASLFMTDQTTDLPVEITVVDGTLLMDGVQNLRTGAMTIAGNQITTVDPAVDIVLGETGDTGDVVLRSRDLTFADATTQTTAWTGAAAAGTLTGTTLAANVVSSSLTSVGTLSSLTVSGITTLGEYTGQHNLGVRQAGVIADGGTLVVDFAVDDIIIAEWGNGMTVNYTNFTVGRNVELFLYKTAGTGTDSFSLDGITPSQSSTGATTVSSTADVTSFVTLTSTTTAITGVYAKV